jgi:hypothetical protein
VALKLQVKPKGIVEQIYVDDIAAIVREIRRLRRCKTSIINNAFRDTLQRLLRDMMSSLSGHPSYLDKANALAISNQKAKNEVSAIWLEMPLNRNGLVDLACRCC